MYKLTNLVLCLAVCLCFVFLNIEGKNVHNPTGIRTDSCENIYDFFGLRNITVNAGPSEKATVCGGRCCTADGEAKLISAARQDLESQLRHHARSLRGRLGHMAVTTRDHVLELATESEKKSLYLFSQIYQRMAVLAKEPITHLYNDIRNFINITSDHTGPSNRNIEKSVLDFFTKLFPLVYHHAVNLQNKDFTHEYKTCLRQAIDEIQPFGEIPNQISKSIIKSLDATRTLLQAFWLGSEVLNTTDALLSHESHKADSCHTALLKMSHCPKCLGLDVKVKPCSGYCLNVLRGCMTQHVSELDHPWNGYISSLEKLVFAVKTPEGSNDVDVDSVIKGLDTRITEAIMYAMENGVSVEKKVHRVCGQAMISDVELPKDNDFDDAQGRRQERPRTQRPTRIGANSRPTRIDTEMIHFQTLVTESKGFFLNLADTLCRDENFAEQNDGVECWNGERIGEYTKIVAAFNFQKYNPEVDVSKAMEQDATPSVSKVAKISDQLRLMTQTILSRLTTLMPSSESYMQGDEAGSVEGSGSGRSGDRFSDDDEGGRDVSSWSGHGDYEGSGSGNGEIEPDDGVRIHRTENGGKSEDSSTTGSAFSLIRSSTWNIIIIMLFILQYCNMREML